MAIRPLIIPTQYTTKNKAKENKITFYKQQLNQHPKQHPHNNKVNLR